MPLARNTIAQVEARITDAKFRIEMADQKIHNPKSQAEFWQGIGERSKAVQDHETWIKCLDQIQAA